MKHLQVLHIIGGGEFGGAERHILTLANALDPKKVTTTVCCLFEEPFVRMVKESGIKAVAVPMRNKLDFGTLDRLAAVVEECRPDLVHTHGVRANLLGRLAARRAGNNRIITTVHSLLAQDYPDFWSRLANSCTERLTRSMTRHFIAVSRGLKDALVKDGLSSDKISVIHNGLDLEHFKPLLPPGSYRRKLGYAPEVPLVAIVARLHAVKGHKYFLEAAGKVLESVPEARFLVVGAGPDRLHLQELTGRLGLEAYVNFVGFVEDVPDLMADLDVLVVPSLWEGFGLTAIEAMTVGVPVVATDVGGLPEVVRSGETGILVPPADPGALARGISWVLRHQAEAEKMAAYGTEVVQREFSAEGMARKTLGVYQKMMGCDNC